MITTAAAITGECVPGYVTRIFGAGEELTAVAERAFRIIVVMYPIVGAQMVIGNFFQSIGHAGKSIFLSLSRQLLLLLPLLAVLPPRYGLDGVWMSMPISDAYLEIVARYAVDDPGCKDSQSNVRAMLYDGSPVLPGAEGHAAAGAVYLYD